MALEMPLEPEGKTVTKRERRSREAYLAMLDGTDYKLTLYREPKTTYSDGTSAIGARDDNPITLLASQAAGVTYQHNGVEESGADLMARLSSFFDELDRLRLAAANPPPAPPT